jgi:hypothetical protein
MLSLAVPTDAEVDGYYDVFSKSGVLAVRNVTGKGKGVFALTDIRAGSTVLKERPFVGAQHTQSKSEAICCRCVLVSYLQPLLTTAHKLHSVFAFGSWEVSRSRS